MLPLMPPPAYAIVVTATLTGLLKYIFQKNNIVKLLHSACGPLANFMFAIYYLFFQWAESGRIQRLILAICFMLLTYTGLVSGKSEPTRKQKYVHITLGVFLLILISFVFFTFVLLWTGLAASIAEFFR
jgi:hypothetical protein